MLPLSLSLSYVSTKAGSVSVFGVDNRYSVFSSVFFSCRFGIRFRYFDIPRYSVSLSVFLKYWLNQAMKTFESKFGRFGTPT